MAKPTHRGPPAPLGGPLGLSVERDAQLFAGWRTAPRPTLVLPLGSCVVQLTRDPRQPAVPVDRASLAVVPRGARYRLSSSSPAAELLTLLVGAEACARARDEYHPHVAADTLDQVLATPQLLPRTRWIDELAQRYLYERTVCFKHTSHAAVFLETELTKELYFLGAERLSGRARSSGVFEGSDALSRARQFVECHLFERVSVAELARVAHTSEATLLRTFLRQLGVTPALYQRARRLEEAVRLLRTGRHAVGEVARRVGYASLPAFTVAFRRQFGMPPSALLASVATGTFLSAQGAAVDPHAHQGAPAPGA